MLLTIRQGVILSVVLLSTFALGGCLYLQPRTLADIEADIDTLKENGARMERLTAETDKKVAEIYSHLYVMRVKVYSNENEIEILKAQSTPDATPKAFEPAPADKTEKSSSQPTPPKASPAPLELSPEEAYKNAYAAYRRRLYKKAISLFTQFVAKYPKHHLADNSQYWIGESYYTMKDYKSALHAFKKVIEQYQGGNKMPDALLKTGYSYLNLEDYQSARTFLTQVIKDYPFSSSAQYAEVKLRKIEGIEGRNMQ